MAMALNINGHGERGDMTGKGFDENGQGSRSAAHTLGTDSQIVDLLQEGFFEVGIIGLDIGCVKRTEQCFLGQEAAHLEIPTDSPADDERRAGIGAGFSDNVDNEVLNSGLTFRGGQHFDLAPVFASAAFEHDGDFEAIAADK